ncbi:hypothetical protein [Streptomyces sp. NPDC059080]|uniref:hypothetical protein n=1 Tax=Streptomyces sp. NPDC059080 TaxID=3346718 RepID=UPI003695E9B3
MHIKSNQEQVPQGGEFEPLAGYEVVFVRREGQRLIFRDGNGEFSRWATADKPSQPRPMMLGERRTVVEVVPDARPITGESIYVLTHQMCVPGGWMDIKTTRCRAPQDLAGIYAPGGSDVEDEKLRGYAAALYGGANEFIDQHPYSRLYELLLKLRLQKGAGEVDGGDDLGVGFEIAELLEKARTM